MNFKTPSPRMAAFIVVVLLALFAFTYLAPALNVSWLRSDVQFDEALKQTLVMLLVLGVGYYIGSTKGSEDKTAIIATQANTAAAAAGSTAPAIGTTPAGTPEDPVSVTEAPKP